MPSRHHTRAPRCPLDDAQDFADLLFVTRQMVIAIEREKDATGKDTGSDGELWNRNDARPVSIAPCCEHLTPRDSATTR
ncbi:hypothetical protein [Tunturiibacter gelidoferens]|uniref:Uncharacterized protein n=1 Tax=Tunturiibacter gelidiferens TaxID=3069689 RepID=A0ACC5NWX8_9BACT|nr:hypothetical protein [Edaphobacter lichenicola]MBB5339098.1 hypothetical protein [Edaphobacter lichenicola]